MSSCTQPLSAPAPTVALPTRHAPSASSEAEASPTVKVLVQFEHIHQDEGVAIDVSLPLMSSTDRWLNPALRQVTTELRNIAYSEIAALQNMAKVDPPSADSTAYTYDATCRPTRIEVDLISVACDIYTFTGGAHGSHGTIGHN